MKSRTGEYFCGLRFAAGEFILSDAEGTLHFGIVVILSEAKDLCFFPSSAYPLRYEKNSVIPSEVIRKAMT